MYVVVKDQWVRLNLLSTAFYFSYAPCICIHCSLTLYPVDLQLAREVLDIAAKAVRVGITTDEIDRIVHEAR